jgi:hypothetical protein
MNFWACFRVQSFEEGQKEKDLNWVESQVGQLTEDTSTCALWTRIWRSQVRIFHVSQSCRLTFWSDAITLIYLPYGPSAYFKLTSIELTKQIFVWSFFLNSAEIDPQPRTGSWKGNSPLSWTRAQRICNTTRTYSWQNVSNGISSATWIPRKTSRNVPQPTWLYLLQAA